MLSKSSILVSAGDLRVDLLALNAKKECHEILLAPPGHVPSFPGLRAMLRDPGQRMPLSTTHAFRSALLTEFARQIDELPQVDHWERKIVEWIEAIRSGRARFLQVKDREVHTRLISRPSSSVVFHGPMGGAVLDENRELVVELSAHEHERARNWFQSLSNGADDISEEVERALEESWAGEWLHPRDIYHKVLTEFFWTTIEGLDVEADDNPMLQQLTEFQVEAYHYAKGILRRYGGVFLADVVGLGKTFIALALLRHLQDQYHQHAVVLAPPNVLPVWKSLAAEFRVEIQVVSTGKLSDLEQYSDREVLVIDESHHFRNTGTQRYQTLQNWLRPGGSSSDRKVLLLSATPQNNDPQDVRNQLALFPDSHSRLPFRGESLDAWFRQVRTGAAQMTDLLQHVVVRRTRRFIQSSYPDATIKIRTVEGAEQTVPLQFPTRISGEAENLRYNVCSVYGANLYQDILHTLRGLSFAQYDLLAYVRPEFSDDPQLSGLRQGGRQILGLYKTLLLKRFESSYVAFRSTIQSFSSKMESRLTELAGGSILISTDVESENGTRTVSTRLFEVQRLTRDLESDIRSVRMLAKAIATLTAENDAKVDRLRQYLHSRPPAGGKAIVFTEFEDTAEYLGEVLGQAFGRTEVVTGARGNALRASRRFSPKASRWSCSPEQELDLLITTDTLSEGVNLQDACTLINYDIHWNPVRLIQRAGRIDRIGSEHEEIHIASFLPERDLENELGLEAVLRRRIDEFLAVFGEDSAILPTDEIMDVDGAVDAYTGAALDSEDDEMDGLSRHMERLMRLRRESPRDYDRVVALRLGRRAASSAAELPVTVTRIGWYWAFWTERFGQEVEAIDDISGLDLLARHADGTGEEELIGDATAASQLVRAAAEAFEGTAATVREQRRRPRLTPAESFVLERLEAYLKSCIASRRELVERVIDWVQAGAAQVQLRRLGAIWRRERLGPERVFDEVRVLYGKFPMREELLGEPQVVGTVVPTIRLLDGPDDGV